MYELNLKSWVVLIVTALFLIVGGVGSCMYIRPKYNVWSQEMAGKAEFAKAEQNRKIKIEEAKANLEAEKLNAQAEIERAREQPKPSASRTAQSPLLTFSTFGYVSRTRTRTTRLSTSRLRQVCPCWRLGAWPRKKKSENFAENLTNPE